MGARGMKAFNVTLPPPPHDAPGPHESGIIVSQRWMAEQYAALHPGASIDEIEVHGEIAAVMGSPEELAWCSRIGIVPP
jgi:hypothetical protein